MADLATSQHITIAVVADLHINSTMGLAAPAVRLDDGQTVQYSHWQAVLWDCWLDFWRQVNYQRQGELIVVFNGDLVDGDHHNTSQIISRNLTDQHKMAITALAPALEHADKVYIVRGTTVHGGHAGQNEELIGREVKAVVSPEGNASWWVLPITVHATRFDFAHHGSLGRLPWTRGNIAKRLAIEIELAYYRQGKPPPHFVIRAHRHQYADSGCDAPVRVLFLPCWQGATDYVQAIAPGAQPHVGGLIFTINGGCNWRAVLYNQELQWQTS